MNKNLDTLNNVYLASLNIDKAGLVIGEGWSDEGNFSFCFRLSAGSTLEDACDYLEEAGEGLICEMVGEGE